MLNPQDVWRIWAESWFRQDQGILARRECWFGWSRQFDRHIRKRLLTYSLLASEDSLKHWQDSDLGVLVQVLLLDRVARKCFRGTVLAYEYDKKARRMARHAVEAQRHRRLPVVQSLFFVAPLLASDRLPDQELAQECLEALQASARIRQDDAELIQLIDDLSLLAQRNALVLQRYRRFPHRAAALGHGLSDAEKQFVANFAWQDWL
ncbi:MAG: DUF924 family protein [Oleiphilaceae bacterium]|nr:DUF924 family protein [Oleiphilaceae bacterium]